MNLYESYVLKFIHLTIVVFTCFFGNLLSAKQPESDISTIVSPTVDPMADLKASENISNITTSLAVVYYKRVRHHEYDGYNLTDEQHATLTADCHFFYHRAFNKIILRIHEVMQRNSRLKLLYYTHSLDLQNIARTSDKLLQSFTRPIFDKKRTFSGQQIDNKLYDIRDLRKLMIDYLFNLRLIDKKPAPSFPPYRKP